MKSCVLKYSSLTASTHLFIMFVTTRASPDGYTVKSKLVSYAKVIAECSPGVVNP